MDVTQIPMILMLAFGLGMLHSLDADHIMAVSNLASGSTMKTGLKFCLRWAVGHGLVLILAGIAVFGLGLSFPPEFSHYAELAVAGVLILLGLMVLWQIRRQRVHVHFHRHDGMPMHAHWHSHQQQGSHQHSHTALFVGMLHGMAGTAPLLALIPLAMAHQAVYGFVYLLVFSLGVASAMLLFGGLLGYFSGYVQRYSATLFRRVRTSLGIGAILVGGLMLGRSLL